MVNPLAWLYGGKFLLDYLGQKKYADEYNESLGEQADELLWLGRENAQAFRDAGKFNANAIMNIGEANATLIERETARNMHMYSIQAEEDRRIHLLNEKLTAGAIRAMVGGSGIQTNTGTPNQYKIAQIKLGIQARMYGDKKTYWSLRNMHESGEDRAWVTRYTAQQNAAVTEYNANMQADMHMRDVERQTAGLGSSMMQAPNLLTSALGAGIQMYGGGMFQSQTGNYSLGNLIGWMGSGPSGGGNANWGGGRF